MNSTSEQQDAQHLRMTTAPVPGLILSLSVPSIITCIITSVYTWPTRSLWRSWARPP
jgi:hypothetical protein